MKDVVMHYVNRVRDVAEKLQEVLHQEQSPIKTPVTVQEPQEHVANALQDTQNKIADQLQQMQTMIQALQLQYYAGQNPT